MGGFKTQPSRRAGWFQSGLVLRRQLWWFWNEDAHRFLSDWIGFKCWRRWVVWGGLVGLLLMLCCCWCSLRGARANGRFSVQFARHHIHHHPSGEQRIKSRNPPPFSLFSPPPRVLCRVPPYPCRGRHVRRLCCAVLGRAERETAYDNRKGDMAKWVAPVQANRQAETLDFAPAVCLYVLMMDVPLAAILELVLTARREVVGLDLPPAAYVHA